MSIRALDRFVYADRRLTIDGDLPATKTCKVCGEEFARSANEHNTQWLLRDTCGGECRIRASKRTHGLVNECQHVNTKTGRRCGIKAPYGDRYCFKHAWLAKRAWRRAAKESV